MVYTMLAEDRSAEDIAALDGALYDGVLGDDWTSGDDDASAGAA